jgi:hypothetical protein
MGYDFSFEMIRNASNRSFPLQHTDLTPDDRRSELPWPAFRAWLIEQAGWENGGADSIWVDYANQGSINFDGDSSSVYVDTHTTWDNVLAAYLVLKSLTPDAVIFDWQDARYHDEVSFRALMKQLGR